MQLPRLRIVIFFLSALVGLDASYCQPLCAAEDLAQQLRAATVRIECQRGDRVAIATGTVIQHSQDSAIIATCGHVFRKKSKSDSIRVTFFGPRSQDATLSVSRHGQLIAVDQHLDVGLLNVPAAPQTPVFPLAQRSSESRKGETVLVAGCDDGKPPVVEWTRVTAEGRFAGRPNIEVAAYPSEGRSGGALVTDKGYLIGVCNGYNPEDKEGIYARVEAFDLLAKRGRSRTHRVEQVRSRFEPQMRLPQHQPNKIIALGRLRRVTL